MDNTKELKIRVASPEDAGKILEIYRPYVGQTAITFEYEVPTLRQMEDRIANTLQMYPYLVAEKGEEIWGYAYTGAFSQRKAYQWAAETSIYIRWDKKKMGIGGQLYRSLESVSQAQNVENLYACVGFPEQEDEHLTTDSVRFHQHMGYRMVGKFYQCGYKFGTWYHVVWMEKKLGLHPNLPAPFLPFPRLSEAVLQSLGFEKLK